MMVTATAKSEVMIHLETRNVQDGQVNQLVQDVPGQFFNMGKTIYLRYQEKAADGQTAAVTFKVSAAGDEVQLSRHQGDNQSRMVFAVDQRVEAKYQTAYGNLPLTILTSKLNVSLVNYPLSGQVAVDYTLFSNGQELGQYKIRLHFTA